MADAIVRHFKTFEERKLIEFGERVRLGVAQVVYDKKPEDIEPLLITVDSHQAGPGSSSGSPSGTEVTILLDAEEWPRDEQGDRRSVEVSDELCAYMARAMGRLLMGGVDEVEGLVVPVWVSQAVSSGYDGYE